MTWVRFCPFFKAHQSVLADHTCLVLHLVFRRTQPDIDAPPTGENSTGGGGGGGEVQ